MKYLLSTLISIFLLNCTSYKKSLVSNGSKNQVIENVIIDFTNTSRLYKKHDVFEIKIIDTLYKQRLEKIDERTYSWVHGEPYEAIIAIKVIPITNKFTYLLSDSLGYKKDYLPSRHKEQDDKLFIWDDNSVETNDENVDILRKYEMVKEDYTGAVFVVDESQKGVHYYMCRNDFTKYKKITTNIGIGYYDAPKVECQ